MTRYPSPDGGFTFAEQAREWEHVPVENAGGYVSARALLERTDAELRAIAATAAASRYDEGRNPDGAWFRHLRIDATRGKHVLDFGCGFGLESLQFAQRGNRVSLVDINESSVKLAARLLAAHGLSRQTVGLWVASDQAPYFDAPPEPVDVFYANGVLHHIPYPREILLRACEVLAPGGEIVLMLYTDKAWEVATGEPAPAVGDDTAQNPLAPTFRRAFDCVGRWADWYSADRVRYRFGDFLDLVDWQPLNRDGVYAAAVLKPRNTKNQKRREMPPVRVT